jgi:hypothetical protein
MTRQQLETTLSSYGAGLEAELSLLRQLESLATQERAASDADNLELVRKISDERTRLMSGLLIVENEIKPLRPVLSDYREQAQQLPGFDAVSALHRVAARLVATIRSADEETLRILHAASEARRAALRAIEQGGQTLSAYRRVVAPPANTAALVNRRG